MVLFTNRFYIDMVMNKRISLLLATAIFLGSLGYGQITTKFWIKLKDKNGTPYSISTPTAFLTQKAVQRRANQGIAIDQTDLPVTPSYISQIDNVTNVRVLYASKWLNAVAVQITSTVSSAINTATSAINTFSFVQSTAPTNKFKVILGKIEDKPFAQEEFRTTAAPNYYGAAYWQNFQLRVDCIHYHGYKGQGMTIAVLDAGFRNVNTLAAFDSLRTRNGILGTRDFVAGGTSVYEDDAHGMSALSCMAAVVPSVMVGSAPQADYWLLRTEDVGSETPSEEYNWIRGAEFADSVGADILSTSLGYTTFDNVAYNHTYSGLNGKTYPMSIAATMAVRKGMFVLNSAGNDGSSAWQYIGVPADADSICTVGAIDSLYNVTSFSSKGPTSDGRIKPDLVARGGNACVASQFGGFTPANGTSFSCPILAGAVACFWQKHNTFSSYKVLDTLRRRATHGNTPNNSRGWGVPDMCALPVGLINHEVSQMQFKLFPNPVKNKVKIEFSGLSMKETTIELFDVMGKKLSSEKVEELSYSLDMTGKAPGVYFVRVKNGDSDRVERLIKE